MLVVLLILLVLLGACREPSPPPDGFAISGAWVLDGTGSDARAVDVVVEGDTIVELTTDTPGLASFAGHGIDGEERGLSILEVPLGKEDGERRLPVGVGIDVRVDRDIEALMGSEPMSFCSHGQLEGPHPRGYGTFPRILGRYVRERGVLTLPEAIRKMTSLPATQMGFADCGRIAPGMKADLVLFDPDTVIDRATTEDPHALSEGIEKV